MTTEAIGIVVIEDDAPIRRMLRASFQPGEAVWHETGSGLDGLQLIAHVNPDLVLLDLGLPDMDGFDLLDQLRSWSTVPLIVITASGRDRDKVRALDGGADDYVTKPFSIPELLARIRVALRHARKPGNAELVTFDSDGLTIDFNRRDVLVDGVTVRLTPIEFKLLASLARNAGRVLTHRQLMEDVWGPGNIESTHTLRVHMASIRRKLETDPAHPRFIRTETGVGYRLIE